MINSLSAGSTGRPTVNSWRPRARILAVLAPLLTCAALSTVRESVTTATSVLILVLWVVAAAATGDRVAGVLAAISGGVWFDFFLTEPYQRLAIADPDDIEAAVLLVVISLAICEVALWGRRQQAQASRRFGYLEGLLQTARTVADGNTPVEAVVAVVSLQIVEVLGADKCRYVKGPVHDVRIALLDHNGVLVRQGQEVNVDRDGLPTDDYVAVPVGRGSRCVGHFLVSAGSRITRPTREERRVAVLLADQVAGAFVDEVR